MCAYVCACVCAHDSNIVATGSCFDRCVRACNVLFETGLRVCVCVCVYVRACVCVRAHMLVCVFMGGGGGHVPFLSVPAEMTWMARRKLEVSQASIGMFMFAA